MTESINTDSYDADVLDSLESEQVYRGHEIRDRYRQETRIRSNVKAKDRAKRLTQSSLFSKIGWGRWQYVGEK